MESNTPRRQFLPILLIFILSSLLFLVAKQWLTGRNVDPMVLLTGNAILFLATAISFVLYTKALRNANVHVFLRMLYASLLIKMFFCLAATLLYALMAGPGVSKIAILGCFGLYVIYTFAEVKILMRLSKFRKNA
ncbi:hypothetical protein ACX0G9_17005 [Flavitalea flava]